MLKEMFAKVSANRSDSYLISLIAGVLLLFNPHGTSKVLFIVAGLLLAANGVVNLLESLKDIRSNPGAAVSAAVRVILGVTLIVNGYWLLSVAAKAFGVYLIIDGISGVTEQHNSTGEKVLHGLMIVGGIMLLVNPLSPIYTAIRWCGIALLVNGIIGLVTGSNVIHH